MSDRFNKSAAYAYVPRCSDDGDDDGAHGRGGDFQRRINDRQKDNHPVAAAAAPYQIKVQGAGTVGANGIYTQDGYFQNVVKYSKRNSKWYGQRRTFYIFQCSVLVDDQNNNNNKKSTTSKDWFITIVPSDCEPGGNTDIDFYRTLGGKGEEEEHCGVPPLTGWVADCKGELPAPTLTFLCKQEAALEGDGGDGVVASMTKNEQSVVAAVGEEDQNKAWRKRNEAWKGQNRALRTQNETLQQEKATWLQEKSGLLKQIQALQKEKEDLIANTKQQEQDAKLQLDQQGKDMETKYQAEIATLRATIDGYKQKELDQLKASYQALQDKVNRFEQKEKQEQERQNLELVKQLAQYEQTNRALQDELIRKDAQMQAGMPSMHHPRLIGGTSGGGQRLNENNSNRHEVDSETTKVAAVPATPTPPRNNVKRARLNGDDDVPHDDEQFNDTKSGAGDHGSWSTSLE